jgi:hypothetical protein|tara:strand:+ start:529 stop:777 length:249 start_codon:yes stop_codon:yes gene_type:complete
MKIQLWDKKGNSELVKSKDVQARLIDGWSFNEPSVLQKASTKGNKRKRIVRKVVVDEPVVLQAKTKIDIDGPDELLNNEEAN